MRDVVNNHQDYATEQKFGLQGCHLDSKLPGKYTKYNVGRNSYGFLVLFIFYFSLKVAGDYVRVIAGGNPRPPPLNDSPGVEMMGPGNHQNRAVSSENWLTDSN